jgi:hypothetical protein
LVANDAIGQLRSIEASTVGSPDAAAAIKRIQDAMLSPAKDAEFLYSSVVIALYGNLETYVEQLAEQFVTDLSARVAHYSDLPERLRANHRRLSGIIADSIESSTRVRASTVADIIANLHSCLSGVEPYLVNAMAFRHHTSNVRLPVVEKIFTDAGALNIRDQLSNDTRFKGPAERMDPGTNDIFFRINDLADRRNDVAHGDPLDLLSPSLLMEYIEIVERFCRTLFEAVLISFVARAGESVHLSIGSPYRVLSSNYVACFELAAGSEFRVNDSLVAYRNDEVYRSGPIESIQVNRVDQTYLRTGAPTRVGIRTDYKCQKTWRYSIMPG